MTALWIAIIIIALLMLLFSIHIKVALLFSTDGENTIELRYGFLRFKIQPKEAGKEIVKEAEEDEESKEPKKPKKKKNTGDILRLVKAVYIDAKNGLFGILGYIFKHAVTIHELNISADYGFEDPMQTGMISGAAYAAVYNVIGFLERHMKLKKWSVNINPDFNEQKLKAGAYLVLGTNVLHIFAIGGIFTETALIILYKAWRLRTSAAKVS